jgi:hypothetical protein
LHLLIATTGQTEIQFLSWIAFLLEKKADPNWVVEESSYYAFRDMTPFTQAVLQHRADVVSLLLEAKADCDHCVWAHPKDFRAFQPPRFSALDLVFMPTPAKNAKECTGEMTAVLRQLLSQQTWKYPTHPGCQVFLPNDEWIRQAYSPMLMDILDPCLPLPSSVLAIIVRYGLNGWWRSRDLGKKCI